VVIRDKDDLNEKIAGFMTDGKSKLNIVTDFDFTITKFYQKNGARGYSTHKVLEVTCSPIHSLIHSLIRIHSGM
jgi:hypothetical protein